jgi:hypothetical protein
MNHGLKDILNAEDFGASLLQRVVDWFNAQKHIQSAAWKYAKILPRLPADVAAGGFVNCLGIVELTP